MLYTLSIIIIYAKNIQAVKKVWPLQNKTGLKCCKIKGGGQEMAVNG